jgi:hypothetical protein
VSIRNARAEVVAYVDADTIHTNLNIGWGLILQPRIGKEPNFGTLRIVHADGSRYDAPERGTEHGKLASAAIKSLVPIGSKLDVVSHGLATDGRRTLASVTLPDGTDWAFLMTSWGFVKHA